jgi:tRNA(Glu) U13 pseudouridine synthase TruD
MVGPKMKQPTGEALALEEAAVRALGLEPEQLRLLGKSAPGTRRDLLLRPSDLQLLPGDGDSFVAKFSLPAGAYASLVIRALTRQDPWLRDTAAEG